MRRLNLTNVKKKPGPRFLIGLLTVSLAVAAFAWWRLPASGASSDDALTWRPVHAMSRTIVAGSPLDFSTIFKNPPAGSEGPVRISPAGHFVVGPKDTPRRLRFHCGSLAWSPASGSFPDKKTADIYARQLRMQGYNLARFHFADATLMSARLHDFDFNPIQVDRLHYLLAALKRNGIYWMFDVLTSQNGAIGGVFPHRWIDKHNLKLRLHVDDKARRHWARLAKKMLATKNPYTGLAPIKDPALALVITTNENGLEFVSILEEIRTGKKGYAQILQPAFNDYLRRRYKTDSALRSAWGGLSTGESLKDGSVKLPRRLSTRGPRMRDLQAFFQRTEDDTFEWSVKTLRDLGYNGPVSAYNNWSITAAHLSRAKLPAVTMNAYHDIVLDLSLGTSIEQSSSLSNDAWYLRDLIGSRWHGRPFIVSEHNHLFWNRHRYESGLVSAAIAGLQDWDGLCRHGPGAIDLTADTDLQHKRYILPYTIGLDPISRASETLIALMFRRGDAKPAQTRFLVPHRTFADVLDDGQGRLPDTLTRLGLVAGLALDDRPAENSGAPNRTSPSARTRTGVRTHVIDRAPFEKQSLWPGEDPADALLKRLAAAGELPASAAPPHTVPSKGIFKAVTGQLALDRSARKATFQSDKTLAIAFDDLPPDATVGGLTIKQASPRGLFALSALDDQPLAKSRRMLLIYATDARNSKMRFADNSAKTVIDWGHRPTVIRHGRVSATFQTKQKGPFQLKRLDLTGREMESRVLTPHNGAVSFTIDNAPAGFDATTYWSLEVQ